MAEEVITEASKLSGAESSPFGKDAVSPEVDGTLPVELSKTPEGVPERVEGKYLELLSQVTPTKTATPADDDHKDTVVLDAKHIGAMTDEGSKVRKLLDLAQTKSVVHAVKVARSLKDYYALDKMHDELADKLYQGLLEKGLIEKE